MSFNAARIVGPSVGGFCVAVFGETACFLINAASYVVVLAALLAMRGIEPERTPATGSALRHLVGGFQYAWAHRRVRALLMVTALANLATTLASVLAPIFADQVFHRGHKAWGSWWARWGWGRGRHARTRTQRQSRQSPSRGAPQRAAGGWHVDRLCAVAFLLCFAGRAGARRLCDLPIAGGGQQSGAGVA
ncbi:MAG: MFS transporter [Acidobacteria bacterium]|nr:MFS transporter [Acidobacteriota bacterium]